MEGGAGPRSPGTGRRVGGGASGRGLGRLQGTPSPGDPGVLRVEDPQRHQGEARPASRSFCASRWHCVESEPPPPTPTPEERRAAWERGCGPTGRRPRPPKWALLWRPQTGAWGEGQYAFPRHSHPQVGDLLEAGTFPPPALGDLRGAVPRTAS